VGSAASVAGPSDGVGSPAAEADADGSPVADADGSPVGDAAPEGVADAVPALRDGLGVTVAPLAVVAGLPVRPVVVGEEGWGVEGAFVVGFGAAVVRVGADVAVAAGGATRGICPAPNRKPMTLPAGGS
jgi:hypothetical protein